MKVTGLIFILSFLAFKLALGENACITTYRSNVYLIETTMTSTNIKSFQPPAESSSSINNNSVIPWRNESETQQGVTSLFSCTTVQHYLFLLITPTIPSEQQANDGENVKSILTFDYDSHQWKTVPLYLDPPSSMLITCSWSTQYIAYNTARRTAYYFDTQLWSWHSNDDQNDTQSPPYPPNTTTTPEMATVNSSLYYFFNDATDYHLNHIYTFDLMTKKWIGHFASFWSNGSSFYFASDHSNQLYALPKMQNDKFMRTINTNATSAVVVQTPTVELQPNDLITDMGGDLVFYNGTRLMIYQPSRNIISGIYGQKDGQAPDSNSTVPVTPFWSTSEGERIKIALGCSLSLGMLLVTVIGAILLRNRRQHQKDDRDLLGNAPVVMDDETNQHGAATGTPAPRTTKLSTSMQSLSFLTRDNAMVWGKHVHQLLALISFRRHQEEDQKEEDDGDYPSMIKTSTTVSALAMSSMILSIISSSYSIAATNNNNAFLTPQTPSTPMNRRSLDMTCPLPRNSLGQAESSSAHLK